MSGGVGWGGDSSVDRGGWVVGEAVGGVRRGGGWGGEEDARHLARARKKKNKRHVTASRREAERKQTASKPQAEAKQKSPRNSPESVRF